MIKLNRPIKTKSGKRVTPYLIQDGVVFAFDLNKNAVTLPMNDFEITSPKKRRVRQPVVMVKGNSPEPEGRIVDKAFDLNEGAGLGGIYSETPLTVLPPTIETIPDPDPIIPDTIEVKSEEKIEYISSTTEHQEVIPTFESKGFKEELPSRVYDIESKSIVIKLSGKSSHYLIAVEEPIGSYDADDFYNSL